MWGVKAHAKPPEGVIWRALAGSVQLLLLVVTWHAAEWSVVGLGAVTGSSGPAWETRFVPASSPFPASADVAWVGWRVLCVGRTQVHWWRWFISMRSLSSRLPCISAACISVSFALCASKLL